MDDEKSTILMGNRERDRELLIIPVVDDEADDKASSSASPARLHHPHHQHHSGREVTTFASSMIFILFAWSDLFLSRLDLRPPRVHCNWGALCFGGILGLGWFAWLLGFVPQPYTNFLDLLLFIWHYWAGTPKHVHNFVQFLVIYTVWN